MINSIWHLDVGTEVYACAHNPHYLIIVIPSLHH